MKNPDMVRIYDNGGKTLDRYTVVYMHEREGKGADKAYNSLSMNSEPFHGIGQHGEAQPGAHLGKRITFKELPEQCQKAVRQDLNATPEQIDTVTHHFLIAMEWADKPEEVGAPDSYNWPMSTIKEAWAYCAQIVYAAGPLFRQAMDQHEEGYGSHPDAGSAEAAFGHDIWLTQAGHGVGFWERKELEVEPRWLDLSERFGLDRNGKKYDLASRGDTLGDQLSALVYGTNNAISQFAYKSVEFYRGQMYFRG